MDAAFPPTEAGGYEPYASFACSNRSTPTHTLFRGAVLSIGPFSPICAISASSADKFVRRRTQIQSPPQPPDPPPYPLFILLRERQPHRVVAAAVDEEGCSGNVGHAGGDGVRDQRGGIDVVAQRHESEQAAVGGR